MQRYIYSRVLYRRLKGMLMKFISGLLVIIAVEAEVHRSSDCAMLLQCYLKIAMRTSYTNCVKELYAIYLQK